MRLIIQPEAADEDIEGIHETRKLVGIQERDYSLASDSDIALYDEGYIVVVPMACDEHNYQLLSRLKKDRGALPEGPPLKEKTVRSVFRVKNKPLLFYSYLNESDGLERAALRA